MTKTTPEVPAGEQLEAAVAALDKAARRYLDAGDAMRAARAAYTRARHTDPAAQTTDQARNAWAEAEHDLVDARVDMERARDELGALERQTAEHATTQETRTDA